MTVLCTKCPLRSRDAFQELSDDDLEFMLDFKTGQLEIAAGEPVVLEGASSPHFYTVLSGLGLRDKALADGRRQITNFVFPGDLVGLQSGLLGEMKHSVEAATDMVLCVFSRDRLRELFQRNPQRAYDVTWLAATEVRSLSEALLTTGRRSAEERVAALLAYLMRRSIESGFTNNAKEMAFPFRQHALADAVGLSLVHTNRMIQKLRSKKLIVLEDDKLIIPDLDALHVAGETDETIDQAPRPLL